MSHLSLVRPLMALYHAGSVDLVPVFQDVDTMDGSVIKD